MFFGQLFPIFDKKPEIRQYVYRNTKFITTIYDTFFAKNNNI